LKEIELCEGLLEIGKHAFKECTSLKKITIPSSVTIIQRGAFRGCVKLEEVKLCTGLQEIRERAFKNCRSLSSIGIPSTVTKICEEAFYETPLLSVDIPIGVSEIGPWAFYGGIFPTARLGSNITQIVGSFSCCNSMFSIQLSESIDSLGTWSLACKSLRNVALPQNTTTESNCFGDERDDYSDDEEDYSDEEEGPKSFTQLMQLFGTTEDITEALKHRFDDLPIHKMVYYQSYNNMTVDQLNSATDIRISQHQCKVNPSGKQKDCLGMTPLHILACSTAYDVELYKVLIEKYPETLVSEDEWGAIPLLYAIWGNAPDEIVLFLIECYKSNYSSYVFNWEKMAETLVGCAAPVKSIGKLLHLHEYFSEQTIDWNGVLEELAKSKYNCSYHDVNNSCKTANYASDIAFDYLVKYCTSKRINTIGIRHLREDIKSFNILSIKRSNENRREHFLCSFRSKLSECETRYHMLKEAFSLLELALWKNSIGVQREKRSNKKMKV